MTDDTRAVAGQVIGRVLTGKSLNQVLPPALQTVATRDRALLQQLCYGTLRQYPRLDPLLKKLLNKPLRERDSDVQGLLLAGLYQLEETRIPDHAAVAATVAASSSLRKNWAKGMINAVLRRYQRERQSLLDSLDHAARLAHPDWLYQALLNQWPAQAEQIMTANNEQPPLCLRVNSGKTTRQNYLQRLASAGLSAHAGTLSPDAVYLEQAIDVADLPGFADGEVSVQDEAAQLAAHLLQPQANECVMDACAAPGGKACHILELQPQLRELIAADNDAQRLLRVQDNFERLQLRGRIERIDAMNPADALPANSFDRILVDAPCSASGVIRRHPDIKVLRIASDISGFAAQQLAILHGLWPLLRPGGTLLYATCSVLEEENSAVVAQFLSAESSATHQSLEVPWGQAADYGRQLLPTPGAHDGLYYCLLSKAG